MHIDMTRGRPIKCSKCGSTDAVKPVNSRDIAIQCRKCGHTKLTHEAEQRQLNEKYPNPNLTWTDLLDDDPTF